MISREEAVKLLETKIKSENMRKHFYASEVVLRSLALRLGKNEEEWGIAGLLHDIGKIVFLATLDNRDVFERIAESRDNRSVINLEEIEQGANHALVGSMLAQKWNFPEDLCEAIEFHLEGLKADGLPIPPASSQVEYVDVPA